MAPPGHAGERANVRILQRGGCGCRQGHGGDHEAFGRGRRGEGWGDVRC